MCFFHSLKFIAKGKTKTVVPSLLISDFKQVQT